MARFTDDDFAALQNAMDADTARALGSVRRADGGRRNAEVEAWLAAGDNLAEKAITALDTGDDTRAARLVDRLVALPVVDEETRSGLMAVNLLLYNAVAGPDAEIGGAPPLLDLPLRLLPTLDEPTTDALRHTLACMTDYELRPADLRRVRDVVALERKFDRPFAGVPEAELPAAVTSVLRLVLLLRAAED